MYRRTRPPLRPVGPGLPTRSLLRMRRIPDFWLNVLGYSMWAVGCLLFAIAAARDGDPVSLIAGLLFLIGVLVVIRPMMRASRDQRRSSD